MLKKTAKAITGGLSSPSKMPCKGYSLPASACITGSKLRKQAGTVCSKCYAHKGMYGFPKVQTALERRLESLDHPDWVEAMVTLIGDSEYFRWHDSGDIQSPRHLHRIVQVIEATASCNHWMPTKEAGMVRDYVKQYGALPENLTIRVSAPKIDGRPGKTPKGVLTSTSVTSGHTCPAPEQDNECRDCRKCWDTSIPNVAYLMH